MAQSSATYLCQGSASSIEPGIDRATTIGLMGRKFSPLRKPGWMLLDRASIARPSEFGIGHRRAPAWPTWWPPSVLVRTFAMDQARNAVLAPVGVAGRPVALTVAPTGAPDQRDHRIPSVRRSLCCARQYPRYPPPSNRRLPRHRRPDPLLATPKWSIRWSGRPVSQCLVFGTWRATAGASRFPRRTTSSSEHS
jgi:hypothetical protein